MFLPEDNELRAQEFGRVRRARRDRRLAILIIPVMLGVKPNQDG